MKRVIVIRHGAFGDMIMITPVLRALKEDGYHVTLNCKKISGEPVMKLNPHVDKFIFAPAEIEDFDKYCEEVAKGYDKVVNLTGTVERSLLKEEGTKAFHWPHEQRHAECNINYYDNSLSVAGYPNIKGKNGELFLSPLEVSEAKRFRNKHRGYYLILWSISGSAPHKIYPFMEYVLAGILNKHKNVMFLMVGDAFCEVFTEGLQHERVKNYVGKWSIRKAMIMTKFVDLVVGPETGVLNAAGCFDTPKLLFLSHSSEENLSKYWKNTKTLHGLTDCYPCHRLNFTADHCNKDLALRSPHCCSKIPVIEVVSAIEEFMGKESYEKAS